MSLHLAHASLSFSTDVTVDTDAPFTPTPDGLLPVVGNAYQVPRDLRVAAAWAGAEAASLFPAATLDSLADVRLETPALAEINPASIRPLAPLTAGVPTDGLRVTDYACNPLPLRAGDPLSIVGTIAPQGSAPSIEAQALIWLTEGCQPVPDVPSLIVPFVLGSALPATTHAWVASAIRFLRPLPGTRFAILELEVVASLGLLAARLALPGSPLKPGVLTATGTNATSFRQARIFESMHLGVLGEFDAFAPPTLETLAVANPASALVRGWMRVAPLDFKGARATSAFTQHPGGCACGACGRKG
ncbi:MAG: hypothetical protein H6747_09695 [Deltaproteobacteria bacterium]|nr:hypothetical protein [Deltaproteobacteria bacterium]